jgi:adenylate cyclase
MPSDDTFTRRICAVLLADVTGFSALMGQDDERTARAVQGLQALVQGVVSDFNGRAEPVAGDAIFATFDSVVAAVDAALQIQRRVAQEDFAGTPLSLRIGIHFGDVLLREGAAFGDAINVASRLQTLAKPGTICISEGVYRQVRNRFDEKFIDLGRQQLKNISDYVHAFLIVPPDFGSVRTRSVRRGPLVWGAAAGALALLGVLGVMTAQHHMAAPPSSSAGISPGAPPAAVPPGQVAPVSAAADKLALGVMGFKSMGGDAGDDWRRDALRDGLNTQLSQLSRIKVYSKEFIDFLITRKGMTEIEAATQLGITKMLSGSFVMVGDVLRIETHVVDVQTGVLETSYTIEGRDADFLDLQNKMALSVISRLNVPVTEEEKQQLFARRNTNVDALKMLLEAEGAGAQPTPDPPQSGLPRWLAAVTVLGPTEARADDTTESRAAILDVIERYRRATEARDLAALAALYKQFSAEQQAAQERYFENVRDLKVAIDNPEIAVVGDEAVVSYTRTDDFTDARTGRPMHVAVRLTKVLTHTDDGWRMAAGK